MDRPSSLSSLKLYLATVLALLVCGVVASGQSIGNYEKEKGQTMLDQVESDIARHYYDANYHGVDLKAVFKEASEKLKKAQSNGQIMGIIAQATLSLEDSHTFFLPPEHQNLTDYGWEMQVVGSDVYVSKVKDKSDAQAKGLKVGDLVHQVGNYQPVRSNLWKLVYLYYALRPQPGMQVLVSSPGAEDREVDVIAKVKERPRIELTDQVDIRHLMRGSLRQT